LSIKYLPKYLQKEARNPGIQLDLIKYLAYNVHFIHQSNLEK